MTLPPDASRRPAPRLAAFLPACLLVGGLMAGCESVPLGPDPAGAPADADAPAARPVDGAVPVVPAFRPPPEPLETVQEKVSPECLDLGRPDDSAKPDYPAAAARVRQEGWVRFRYDVQDGQLVNAQVMQSSPAGLFDDAVLAWARGLRFPSGRSASGCVMEYEYRLEAVPSAAR